MARRSYAGGAKATLSTGLFTAADLTLNVVATDGWPDGSGGPFAVVIDKDTAAEEKILCLTAVGTVITVSQRGYDGTVAVDHSANAPVEHCHTAFDANEANDHVNRATNAHGVGTGVAIVGTSTVQTLSGKTLDFTDPAPTGNTATNIPLAASPQTITALNNVLASSVQKATLVGQIIMSVSVAQPLGWLPCQGQSLTRATYPALADALGVPSGDSSFLLPDFRDRFPMGASDTAALASLGGAATVTLADTNIPAHGHTVSGDSAGTPSTAAGSGNHSHGGGTAGASVDHSHAFTTAADGAHQHSALIGPITNVNQTAAAAVKMVGSNDTAGRVQGSIPSSAPTGPHQHSGNTAGHSVDHSHGIPAEAHGHTMNAMGPHSHTVSGRTGGAQTPVPTIPPRLAVNFLIYTGVEA